MSRHRRAAHLAPTTEAEVEAQMSELFVRNGWKPLKTEAGMKKRSGHAGYIPAGWPDMAYFLALGKTGLCLSALVETKSTTGKLRPDQVSLHAELRQEYGITVHVVRDPQDALSIIQKGRAIKAALAKVGLL